MTTRQAAAKGSIEVLVDEEAFSSGADYVVIAAGPRGSCTLATFRAATSSAGVAAVVTERIKRLREARDDANTYALSVAETLGLYCEWLLGDDGLPSEPTGHHP